MPARRLAVLDRLIGELRTIWSSEPDLETRMRRASTILEAVLADVQLLAHSKTWPFIIRSERLVGRTLQHGFDPEARTVRDMSGPTQVPFELVASE